MESLIRNIRVGARSLRRTPGFTLLATLTLALGIGLSTAVFTVADALLLRRLPVRDQDAVIVLSGQTRDRRIDNYPLGLDGAREFARRSRSLAAVSFFAYEGAQPMAVRDGDGISLLRRALVAGDFFAVLDATPVLGRTLRAEDDVRGAAPVLVLSYRAWQARFGGTADILGTHITMHEDGSTYTIVGVMPQGLDFPRGTDAWAAVLPATAERNLPLIALNVMGRLASNATPAHARDEMTAYFTRDGAPPWQRDLLGVARTLPQLVLGDTRTAVLVFVAASALLLLITCINIANLLLVRGIARVREIAVRSALGAGRRQVVAQLLTEHALLAIAGGVLGLVVATWGVRAFVALAPPGLPRLDEVDVRAAALAAAAGITAVSLLVFAVAPAVVTARVDLQQVLRSGTRQSADRRFGRAAEVLVVGQVVLALLVLSAAGLLARSFIRLERADLAFEPSQLLVADLALRSGRYETAAEQRALLEQLLPAVRAIPEVHAVSPVVAAPFAGSGGWDGRPAAEGQTPEEAAGNPLLNMEVVTPDYFATVGAPVLLGRGFTDEDREGSPAVVVISQSTARHFWGAEDPIGRRLTFGPSSDQRTLTVVGVVPDTRYRDLREARPSIYFPLAQSFFPFAPNLLVLRTSGPPTRVIPALRRVLQETDPDIVLASAAPFETFLEAPLGQPRLNALLLGAFAVAALVLATVGLFGVVAAIVRQRTRELGVRMALGASRADVGWLVLRRGLALAAAGTALGLMGALAANRLFATLLFEVSPTDGLTLGAVAILLLGVAAVASFIPARASARIEPVAALRAD